MMTFAKMSLKEISDNDFIEMRYIANLPRLFIPQISTRRNTHQVNLYDEYE